MCPRGIIGTSTVFDGRTSELDDIFIFKNVIVLMEYTIGSPGTYLLKKKSIYDKILKRAYVLRKDGWRNKESIGLYPRMVVKNKIEGDARYEKTISKLRKIQNLLVTGILYPELRHR